MISDVMKELRIEQGLTLKQIADKIGVSEATVQRWESGNIKSLRQGRIAMLAEILHTTPSHLMGWDEPDAVEEIQDELFEKRKILFDLSQKATAEDLDKFIKMLNVMLGEDE